MQVSGSELIGAKEAWTRPGALEIYGAPEGADAAALAEAARLRGGVTLFVARDETRAAQFEAAANFFAPDIASMRLPAWDSLPYDRISPAATVAAQRCAALAHLARLKPGAPPLLVIATASASSTVNLEKGLVNLRLGLALEVATTPFGTSSGGFVFKLDPATGVYRPRAK